jgi:hypothetical protein
MAREMIQRGFQRSRKVNRLGTILFFALSTILLMSIVVGIQTLRAS